MSSRRFDGGPAIRCSPVRAFRPSRADSSVALITAAGEIVVGAVGMPIFELVELLGPFVRFTILGAPRTTVRPSSSSSCVANLPDRADDLPGGTVARRLGGGAPAAGRTDGRTEI